MAAIQAFAKRLSAMRSPGSVTLQRDVSVARITLHNPERRNALSGPMMAQVLYAAPKRHALEKCSCCRVMRARPARARRSSPTR
eukprot:4325444-Prymnesium_polylepis.1